MKNISQSKKNIDTIQGAENSKCFQQIFEEQVVKTPNAIAVTEGERSLTYKQLNEKSNQLAWKIRENGIQKEKSIAIICDRRIELFVAILAVSKAGAAYLPIDCTYPVERMEYMLEDSEAELILVGDINEKTKECINKSGIEMLSLFDNASYADEKENLPLINNPKDLLCLIYTSGTTGKPKGVMIEHNAMYALKNHYVEEGKILSTDRIVQFAGCSFVVMQFELAMSLLMGAELHIISESIRKEPVQLEEYVNKNGITAIILPPQYCGQLNLCGIKKVFTIGSATNSKIVNKHTKWHEYINYYGSSEGAICTSWCCGKGHIAPVIIPIGKPVWGKNIFILSNGKICETGEKGEICIAGAGIARGYKNLPELTKEKFIINPISKERMYRTGDFGRWMEDGNIEYLGRIDDQMNIRGFRIEPMEIEQIMKEFPYITDAAVTCKQLEDDEIVCAYFTSEHSVDLNMLFRDLAEKLPEYMIPSYAMQLEVLPVNSNGKIDRKALPHPYQHKSDNLIKPVNETEEIILSAFQEVLGIKNIGIKDNFFHLGGHSLQATKVRNLLEERTGYSLSVRDIFDHPSAESLTEIMQLQDKYMPIPKADEKEKYQMSSAQKRMYTIQQLDNSSVAYNNPLCYRIAGDIQTADIRRVLDIMLERHAILRTSFFVENDSYIQKIENNVSPNFDYEESEQSVDEILDDFVTPFRLDKAPLFRVKLVRRKEDCILLFDMHHIITDGTSMQIFVREFSELYNKNVLESVPLQYQDYSEWMQRKELSLQEEYWLKQFGDEVPVLDIAYDFKRPAVQSFEGACIYRTVPKELAEKVRDFSVRMDCTEYMVLLSVYMILLSRYSAQNDIVVGTPVSGRNHKDIENMLGMFVNTLAIRSNVEGSKKYVDFLNEIRKITLASYENQEYPFEKLVEKLDLKKDLSRNPLFDVMFVFQNYENYGLKLGNVQADELPINKRVSQVDMTLYIQYPESAMQICLEYCTDLIQKETAERFLEQYMGILDSIMDNEEVMLRSLDVITQKEKIQVLEQFNDTTQIGQDNKTIIEMFEEQVERTPDNVAIVFEKETYTYEAFNRKVNSLANKLRSFGVKPGDYVAIITERCSEMLLGIYAIIKSGAAYVPIDPLYPDDRIQYILNDCNPKAVLTKNFDLAMDIPVFDLSDEELWNSNCENPERINKPEDIIYVIYTSGTTGKPKGVMNRHKGIVNLLVWMQQKYMLGERDSILQKTTYVFDVSASEIFWWSISGSRLVIMKSGEEKDPDAIVDIIQEKEITVVDFVPSMLSMLIASIGKNSTTIRKLKSLRYIIAAGEALNEECVNALYRMLDEENIDTELINLYGPTEASIYTTYYHCDRECKTVPIGKPINNVQIYILSENALCGIGIPGELCIAGEGLAAGYLNQTELTAQKFVKNPFGEGIMYRTGDLAKWRMDGNIEYLGRIDEQVKIRGFRIELGEIESVLRKQESVKEAAVIVRENNGDKHLCAYIVGEKGIELSSIKQKMREELPDYMIPAYMMMVDRIPTTINGKLDKRALPEIAFTEDDDYIAPANETEEQFVVIFSEILGIKKIGVEKSFFDMGGDSIKAIRVVSKLRESGYMLSVKDIMNERSIRRLALIARKEQSVTYSQDVVTGSVQTTQVMKWFFNGNMKKPEHFNQSIVIKADKFDRQALKAALKEIVIHHDMLRAVWKDKLYIRDINQGDLFGYNEIEITVDDEKEIVKFIAEEGTKQQEKMNLANGPLFQVVLFDAGKEEHLLLVAHHFVVDGVSWRILLEDLKKGYQQYKKEEKIHLADKTASFQEWANALEEYGKSKKLQKEKEYWDEVSEQIEQGKFAAQKSEEWQLNTIEVSFDKETSRELVYNAGKAYQTEINDLLLTALGMAVYQTTGQKKLAVYMEGHGREELHRELAIDRTVGWFTSVYPVILDIGESIRKNIIITKEMFREIPNNGIGYGVLKNCEEAECYNSEPDICFNYLGDFNEGVDADEEIRFSEYNGGMDVSEQNQLPVPITINGKQQEEGLQFVVSYDEGKYERSFIEKLVQNFNTSIRNIVKHCIEKEAPEKTASDYGLQGMSIDSFEKVSRRLNGFCNSIYEMTPLQEGMLYHNLTRNDTGEYFIQYIFSATQKVDKNLVEEAIRLLAEKHEVIKTQIIFDGVDKPLQMIPEDWEPEIVIEDISGEENSIAAFEAIKEADIARGFDFTEDTLLRVKIVYINENDTKIIWSMHHIIVDGWSIPILFNTFVSFYTRLQMGENSEEIKKEIRVQNYGKPVYGDYVKWLREQDKEEAFAYWEKLLSDYDTVAAIEPCTVQKTSNSSVKLCDLYISKELTKKIEDSAKFYGVTINTMLETAIGILLQRYNNADDVVFGKVISGRNAELREIEKMTGLFINTIPQRVKCAKTASVEAVLKEVQAQANESTRYDFLGLSEIQDKSSLRSDLIKTIFAFENYYIDEDNSQKNEIFHFQEMREQTNFDVSFMAFQTDTLNLRVMYKEAIYCSQEMERLLAQLEMLLAQMAENTRLNICELEIVTLQERRKILEEFNNTSMDYPADKTVIDLFEEQAEKYPSDIAIVAGTENITYKDLNQKANVLADKIRKLGVKPNDLVAIIAEKGIEMIAGILAILKSGGAYVPIDPAYPENRIHYILSDCNPKAVLVYQKKGTGEGSNTPTLVDKVSGLIEKDKEISCIDLALSEVWEGALNNPMHVNKLEDLAYIIYTSGTTGKPKGVLVEHKGIPNLREYFIQTQKSGHGDKALQFASFAFDAMVSELCMSILVGGQLHLVDKDTQQDIEQMEDYIQKNQITSAILPPQYAQQVNTGKLRNLITAGAESNSEIVAKNCEIMYSNDYGPTEATVCATHWEPAYGNEVPARVPIGKPINNVKIYILSGNMLCGIGMPGELCIAGVGVAKGYLNNPSLTEEKFTSNPYGDGRLYRTGDLARWLPDGNIDFLGRIDEQIKIRGFRIEIGEIESVIRKIPEVLDVAVVVCGHGGDRFLSAFVIGKNKLNIQGIRSEIQRQLPEYMLPAHITQIEAFPATSNGKLDKKALARIEVEDTSVYIAPRNEVEKDIAEIFSKIMNVSKISVQQSFFELGGDSIKAIRVVSRLREVGYKVTVKNIMEEKTIERIALTCMKTDKNTYSQKTVKGAVEATPVVNWFWEQEFKKPEHFNQSMLVKCKKFDRDALREALNRVVLHHDVLRAVCREKELYIRNVEEGILFDFREYKIAGKMQEEIKSSIAEIGTGIQGEFDLVNGPLFRVALFETETEEHLLLIAHHLVIDGVSWRILLEDLESGYSQYREKQKIELPEKTASYQEWASLLNEYGESEECKTESAYWENISKKVKEATISKHLTEEYASEGASYSETDTITMELEHNIVEQLVYQAGKAYNTKIDDLLTTALAMAVRKVTGQENVAIQMEGHGRQELHKEIVIDRTVGWFTSIYPVVTKVGDDTRKNIIETKEMLRAVPNNGIGYGVLKYSAGSESFMEKPDICFNYLGDYSELEDSMSREIKISEMTGGMEVSGENCQPVPFTINGWLKNGKLEFYFTYDTGFCVRKFVEELACSFKTSMKAIIKHCVEKKESEKTASDYGIKGVDVYQFDKLLEKLDGNYEDIYSLTPLQEGMLYHNITNGGTGEYFLQHEFATANDIDKDRLTDALILLAEKHKVLKTQIVYSGINVPVQAISQYWLPEVTETDLSVRLNALEVMEEIKQQDIQRGFNFETDSLLRVMIVKMPECESRLLWSMHHIIIDGWSISLIFNTFFDYLNRLNCGEKKEEILEEIRKESTEDQKYGEYVRWLQKQQNVRGLSYWADVLKDYDTVAEISPSGQGTEGGLTESVTQNITPVQKCKIEETAREYGVTINTMVETAIGIVLQNYNHTNDVVFGKVVSGRNSELKKIEKLVGLFINTIPQRVKCDENMTVRELAGKVQSQSNESTAFEMVGLADIQKETTLRSNLIKIILAFENYFVEQEDSGLEEAGFLQKSSREQTNYDISIFASAEEDSMLLRVMFNQELYSQSEIKTFLERIVLVLLQMTEAPDSRVSELEVTTKAEKELILGSFNDTDAPYPAEKTLVNLIEEQVEKNPDNIAVMFRDEYVTYRELNQQVNALAHKLREMGVGQDTFVAIIAERSIQMIAGIYAIIKAGGAYVPIAPDYPIKRIDYILEDCKPKTILVYGDASQKCLSEINTSTPIIDLSEGNIWKGIEENPKQINKTEDPAYLIYTSGTTGRPKGVVISHTSLINRILWMDHCYPVRCDDVILQKTTYTFDVSVWEIFWWSFTGAAVAMLIPGGEKDPAIICDAIEKYKVTTMHFVPSMLSVFEEYLRENLESTERLNSLKWVFSSGEALNVKQTEDFYGLIGRINKKVRLSNFYGPTEASIDVSYYDCGFHEKSIPIGKPIYNTQLYVLKGMSLCGIGMPGELCIAGVGLAREYLNRPELTAEKFVENPFGDGRLYRTGDLARWRADGNIEYLGRIDEQVKIRGFRIELGEIESVIQKQEGVKDAVVIARERNGDKQLHAYVVPEEKLDMAELKTALRRELPEYMVPPFMMQLENIPVTGNGKLDKRALPQIEMEEEQEYCAPVNETEEALAGIFGEILGMAKVSTKAGFFEMGGHSLKAIKLVNCIEERMGVRIALKSIFENDSIKELAVLIEKAEDNIYQRIPKAEEKEYYAMSSTQKRTYIIQKMDGGTAYNMPQMLKISGEIDAERLREALRKLMERHEILRTCLLVKDGEMVQKVKEDYVPDFVVMKAADKTGEELFREFLRPFDLGNGNVVRMQVAEAGDGTYLMLDMHHAVSDGASLAVFHRELGMLYNGEELANKPLQYRDYSEWMRERNLEEQKEYWTGQFKEEVPVLELPLDFRRPQEQSHEGAVVGVEIPEEQRKAVLELSKETGATEYMILLSAAMILLSKYSGQEDIVVGSPVNGRMHRETENIMGMFVNTLAMRGKPEKEKRYLDFLEEIKETALKAYDNQEYPFEELVEEVEVRRDLSRNPLFDVMFVMQDNKDEKLELAGAEISVMEIEHTIAKFDLCFNVGEMEETYGILMEYCTALFARESAERILSHYIQIVKNILNNPNITIGEIEVITEEERTLIQSVFNDTESDYPKNKTIVELFEEQAENNPDKTALICEGESITYRELNGRANAIAEGLRKAGVKPDDTVVLMGERGISLITGLYGIIKSGGAYVPIDPQYPEERVEYILKDCSPKAVVTYHVGERTGYGIPQLKLEDYEEQIDSRNPERVNRPEDLMYVIYTSGTTGKPKGVMIEHRSVVNFITANEANVFQSELINSCNGVYSSNKIVFDITLQEFILPLCNGKTVILSKDEMDIFSENDRKAMAQTGDVGLITTPTKLKACLNTGMKQGFLEDVKLIMLGAEELDSRTVRKLQEQTKAVIFNGYGPTETTCGVLYYLCGEEPDAIPIGKPISNTQIYILMGNSLCGIGMPGELCIAGAGLARGYLNRPELTAEKFVENPFGEGRLYRTGDLARWCADGNIEYLGRIDEQVKIRGFRIELGEIESVIRKQEGVKDAVVIARERDGDKQLHAYVVPEERLDIAELKTAIRRELPEYMVPPFMMELENIPVTGNGKLDKKALPQIEMEEAEEYYAPANETEEMLAEIFAEILGMKKVSIKAGFFEMGGHSLKAIKLVNCIEERMGVRISLKSIFEHNSIEELASLVEKAEDNTYQRIPKAEEKEYYAMSSTQKRTYIIQKMDGGIAYNMPQMLKISGEIDTERLKEALWKLMERHEILRTCLLVKDGEMVQTVKEDYAPDFVVKKAVGKTREELFREFLQPFDLENGNVVRMQIAKAEDGTYLMVDMHHAVSDAASLALFQHELSMLYNGEEFVNKPLQYRDYSEWMCGRSLEKQKQYWVGQFEGEIPVLDLPLDFRRPQEQSHDGAVVEVELFEEHKKEILDLSIATGATEYMILLSAAMILLSRYSGQEDIVIGSPVSGRVHRETENIMGMFVNTLALRGKPEKEKLYLDFLEEIKETALKAYDNQEYPFEELVEEVEVRRDLSRNPLFDVMLAMQENLQEKLEFAGTKASVIENEHTIAKFDLCFNVGEAGEKYGIFMEYCTALFTRESAERILSHYVQTIKSILKNPNVTIGEIEVITEEERMQIQSVFNDTESDYPKNKTIVELFEEQAENNPDKTALICEGESITYRELNGRANAIARGLRKAGVKPDDTVALMGERGISLITGLYGIIKSGGAYVPIDPQYPEERVEYILKDCSPKAVVTYHVGEGTGYDIPQLKLEDYEEQIDSRNPERVNSPKDLMYVIYTSGTTGKPKGVMIEHRSVVNFITANEANAFQSELINRCNGVYSSNRIVFDITLQELILPLCNGKTVILSKDEMDIFSENDRKAMAQTGDVGLITTPTKLKACLNTGMKQGFLEDVKLIMLGAEELDSRIVKTLQEQTKAVIFNGYGPTETTCGVLYYLCGEEPDAIPIGKPISNTQIYILKGNSLCGIGMPGELCIAGAGLARGYLNRPELTVEKFVENPFGEGRLYRTGDLARWRTDGNIEYLGRIDEQVKIRGFRIEPGEIENTIRKQVGVKDVVVIAREKDGDKYLCAYVTGEDILDLSEIKKAIAEDLPEYMIPSRMQQLDSFPVTVNGKLDKKALPEIEMEDMVEYTAPGNPTEEKFAEIFGEILGINKVGIMTSFFDMGGDSIKAIRVVSRLREAGYKITVKDIMSEKTIDRLAAISQRTEENVCVQGLVTGKVEMTPIIQWFSNAKMKKPEHFNQSMMVKTKYFDRRALKQSLEQLVIHHDMLRAVWRDGLYIREPGDGALYGYSEIRVPSENDKEIAEFIKEVGTEIQSGIDLKNGPLFIAALFELEGEEHLLLVAHHLVVDGVSWRIILEDLRKGYEQYLREEKIDFPQKTFSYQQWSLALIEYGRNNVLQKEKQYWDEVANEIREGQIKTFRQEAYQPQSLFFTLEKDATDKLLYQAEKKYNTQINELMLAALAMTVHSVTGQEKIAVQMEGHGREEIKKDFVIDRTVGWFTCQYPVVLEAGENIQMNIIRTKEMIRKIPNHGIGYGILECLNKETAYEEKPDIGFNYLGDFSEKTVSTGNEITASEYLGGREIAEENQLPFSININGMISEGSLTFKILFDAGKFEIAFIERLANEFHNKLDEIIRHCTEDNKSVKTASDFEVDDYSVEEFSNLMKELDGLL